MFVWFQQVMKQAVGLVFALLLVPLMLLKFSCKNRVSQPPVPVDLFLTPGSTHGRRIGSN